MAVAPLQERQTVNYHLLEIDIETAEMCRAMYIF